MFCRSFLCCNKNYKSLLYLGLLTETKELILCFFSQSDCQVHLQPQLIPPNMEEYMNSLLTAVLPSILNKFRIYLSLLRLLDYSISDEVTKVHTASVTSVYCAFNLGLNHLFCTYTIFFFNKVAYHLYQTSHSLWIYFWSFKFRGR